MCRLFVLVRCRAKGASEQVIYKVEVPANRYDLLCVEGLVLGLLIFQQKCSAPVYRRFTAPDMMVDMYTRPATANVRPFVVGAVLRGIKLTPERYQSFIDLQVINISLSYYHKWSYHYVLIILLAYYYDIIM